MRSIKTLLYLCALLIGAGISVSAQAPVAGDMLTVDFNGDTVDATPGDGQCADSQGRCSLRAAVAEANVGPSSDAIVFALPHPSVIDLTLGELLISTRITIVGPGARRLTVQRTFAPQTPDFRIFRISFGGSANVRGLTVKNGRITGALYGGGFYVEQSAWLELSDVAVIDNFALYGGGVANWGFLNITRCLFKGNRGNNWAGAIYNVHIPQPTARITNSTITGNSAGAHGAISNDGTMALINSTVTHNSADDITTGIASSPDGTLQVLNSVIGADSSPTLTSLGGTFVSLGNNIITDARNSTGFVNGVNNDQVSNANAIDPMLGALANNGGQTDTRALLAGSPAINMGSNCVINATCSGIPPFAISSDQRQGFRRQTDETVDVGAFEYNSSELSGSFGFRFGIFNRPAFYGGSVASLTNALTLEKRYTAVNQFGSAGFQNLPYGVYLFQVKSKRIGRSMGPVVIGPDDFISFGIPLSEARGREYSIDIKRTSDY